MPETILHIGYPKTGTSWFTDFFYPAVTNAYVSYNKDLYCSFRPANESIEIRMNRELSSGEKHVVVAHKLSGLVDFVWNNGEYRDFFIRQLKHNFPDAHIVIFLRNQMNFIASAYSSYLTHGGTYTFKKLFRTGKLGDGSMFSFDYLKYDEMIALYKSHFAKVSVYVYEDFQEDNISFLQRFCKETGLETDIASLKMEKYNEKLRRRFAAFIRICNLFQKKGVQPKRHLVNMPLLFTWMTKQKLIHYNYYRFWGNKLSTEEVLGKELMEYISEYYKESNHNLMKNYGLTQIEKYRYPL